MKYKEMIFPAVLTVAFIGGAFVFDHDKTPRPKKNDIHDGDVYEELLTGNRFSVCSQVNGTHYFYERKAGENIECKKGERCYVFCNNKNVRLFAYNKETIDQRLQRLSP